ncbi:ras-related protein Rab-8A-like isoform X1 [Antedon mediterranea]|uniref:ras-related protein Rab-8A-like isoform X1 n=1 Tax=Antedon mediterranea TaxID=105859 RepID=UPI003AF4F468
MTFICAWAMRCFLFACVIVFSFSVSLYQMATKKYNFLLKFVIIGDSRVGKSSLLLRFVDDTFDPSFICTIGIDFKVRTIEIDGKKVKLQIWDIPGSERIMCLMPSYYRGSKGIIVVYDITNIKSFENSRVWLDNVKEKASEDVELMLLGNKCDEEDKQVSEEDGQQLAAEYGMKFMETSAKEAINVEKAFITLAEDVFAKMSMELQEASPEKSTEKTRKSGCFVL